MCSLILEGSAARTFGNDEEDSNQAQNRWLGERHANIRLTRGDVPVEGLGRITQAVRLLPE